MLAPISEGRQDGRSSFRRLSQYILESIDPLTNERIPRGEFFISDNLQNFDEDPNEAITVVAAIMRATAAQNLNTPDPIFHFQLCLRPGETMTSEQFRDSVMHALAGCKYKYRDSNGKEQVGSYADHQFVAGMHTDKEHTHAHVMVNRVHPDRLTAHTPEFSMKSLDKSCRELEHKYGWKESPGLYRWDRELGIAVEVPEEELEQRREDKLRTRRGAEGKAAHLEYYGDEESVLNKVRRTAAKPLRELCAQSGTRWKDVHALLAGFGFELHKSETGGYTVEDVSTGTRVKASKAFRAPYHKNGNEAGIPGAFCGKKNRGATEERLGTWEPMSAEIRSTIVRQPVFRSREAWAKQTGGFDRLNKDHQQAASAAFSKWQKEHGENIPKITVEEFVTNCQKPSERRAAQQARREEPAAWHKNPPKSPRWVLQSGGFDALSPELKKEAEFAYSEWANKQPDAARRYTVTEYVEHRQKRIAEKLEAQKATAERRNENRARRAADRRMLDEDFQAYRKTCGERLTAHANEGRARFDQLRDAAKAKKAVIRADRATRWFLRRVQLQQVDRELAEAKKALRETLAMEKTSLKPLRREQWVTMRAESGDGRAIRQLRGWRYQNARLRKASERAAMQQPSLSAGDPRVEAPATWAMVSLARIREEEAKRQKEISDAFKTLSHKFDPRTGDVRILIDGKDAVIDRGKFLNVVADTEAARVLALEMAVNKFGSPLTATGSDEWKRSVALTAARNEINVSFVDEAMNSAIREERQRIAGERRKAVQSAAVEHVRRPLSARHPDVQFVDSALEKLARHELTIESSDRHQIELLIAAALLERNGTASEQLRRANSFVDDVLAGARTGEVRRAPTLATLQLEVTFNDVRRPLYRVTLNSDAIETFGTCLKRVSTHVQRELGKSVEPRSRTKQTAKGQGQGR